MLALQDATSDIFSEAIVISLPSVNREDSYSLFLYYELFIPWNHSFHKFNYLARGLSAKFYNNTNSAKL